MRIDERRPNLLAADAAPLQAGGDGLSAVNTWRPSGQYSNGRATLG